MAKSLNQVELIGYLGGDPELRYTQSGSAVASVNIATTRSFKRGDSADWEEETEWTPLVVWNKTAEALNNYAHKGSRIYVRGRLATRSWDDKETGTKRFKTEVVVEDLIFLDSKSNGNGDSQPTASAPVKPASKPATPARNKPAPVTEEDLPF